MSPSGVEECIQLAIQENRNTLLEPEAKKILRAYGLPTPDFGVARNPQEAGEMAGKVGFPIVMKIVSPDILHKTEANGVLLDIKSKEEAQAGKPWSP